MPWQAKGGASIILFTVSAFNVLSSVAPAINANASFSSDGGFKMYAKAFARAPLGLCVSHY